MPNLFYLGLISREDVLGDVRHASNGALEAYVVRSKNLSDASLRYQSIKADA